MRGALRIGRLLGIDVVVHWSLPLVMLVLGALTFASSRDVAALAAGSILMILLFACVVLHELGHALAARRFGIETRDITLLAFGGDARLERMPASPGQELWIALAGPMVNIAIVTLATPIYTLCFGFDGLLNASGFAARICRDLILLNGVMAVFNLLPIFPMDGGRVLRASLSIVFSPVTATRVAAGVGQCLAVVVGAFGVVVLRNPIMLAMAMFLFVSARRESDSARLWARLKDLEARHAIAPSCVTVSPFDSIERAAQLLTLSGQRILPIAHNDDFCGALTIECVADIYNNGLKDVPAIEVLGEDVPLVAPSEPLLEVTEKLRSTGFHSLPVVQGRWLVGIVTRDSIAATLQTRKSQSPPSPHSSRRQPTEVV